MWNDDLVDFDIPNDRLQTALFAIKLGADVESVSEYLTWQDFESITGVINKKKDVVFIVSDRDAHSWKGLDWAYYTKNQNPTWACIASQNIGGNASKSIEVVQSKQVDGAAAVVAGTSKQTDAAVVNATEIVTAVDSASRQCDPVVNASKAAVANASKQSNVVENAPRTSGVPTPSQLSATPQNIRIRKNARKAGDDILPAGKLSAQKKAKKGNFPERQEVIESSDDGMDHDADSEEDNDEVNDSNKSQKLSSHNSNQKNDVIDSSSIENPSQKIEEFSSQESSQSSSSMLPPGQGCKGSLSKLKKKTLSVGDLSYSDSDLSTQSSELKRQKEHEEQVLWNSCAK